jgi:putative PIN family toxin of toxin-antitoxin system
VPGAVIDTNIWLDLYIFADAGAQALARCLAAGRLRAIRSDPTDAELRRVLARPAFASRVAALGPEPLQAWETLATRCVPQRPAPWLCRDPDDQKFLDLAYSAGAALLFTKDRALLSLARRARATGLAIREPKNYAPSAGDASVIGYR